MASEEVSAETQAEGLELSALLEHIDKARLDSTPEVQFSSPEIATKSSHLDLTRVSNGSISSVPWETLTLIVEQRKSSKPPQLPDRSYYEDLGSPVYDRMSRWRNKRLIASEEAKKHLEQRELENCSFHPAVTRRSEQVYKGKMTVSDRTKRWKQDSQQRIKALKAKLEEETKSDCPFAPTLLRPQQGKRPFNGALFYKRNMDWVKWVKEKDSDAADRRTERKRPSRSIGASVSRARPLSSSLNVREAALSAHIAMLERQVASVLQSPGDN